MKKTLLSIALALFGLGAMAQVDDTFVFCDAKGNPVANGSVVNITKVETDPFDESIMTMNSDICVKYNGTGNGAWASMTINIKQMDNGKLQHCFPGNCFIYDVAGLHIRQEAAAVKVGELQNINSEWLPTGKGLCTVDYTLRLTDRDGYFKAEGPTVTVNYCNGVEPPSNVTGVEATVYGGRSYNLHGQQVDEHYHGVVIRNGKKIVQ